MTKDMYILGLTFVGHDASAAIIKNGEVLASSMEERFTRVKKDRAFPTNAMNFCLKFAGITLDDVDVITYYLDPEEDFDQKVVHYLGKYYPKSVPLFKPLLDRCLKIKAVEKTIRDTLDFRKEIYFCNHHMAHIASSFHCSKFDSGVAISIDGLGEIWSCVIADVTDNEIKVLKTQDFPHSLGMFYSAVTHYLGFSGVSDAGKVMGLSSYGDPSVYIEEMRKIITVDDEKLYEIDLDYVEYPFQRDLWISEKFIKTFGPKRNPDEPLEKRHKDVAAALQARIEEVFIHLGKVAKKLSGRDYCCLSGGVALNSVANGKLLQEEIFKDIYLPPPCGDDGLSIGAPLYYYYVEKKLGKKHIPLKDPYLGTGYTNDEIEKVIKDFGLKYKKSDNLCKETAQILADNKIIGWFQGRMEVGPRALGNRSILANPGLNNVKEILNARVKFREPFRPFAPSILVEDVAEWFVYDHPAPYMLFVFDIKEEKRKLIPGVTHVDGSGRLQSISKEMNPRYHELISEFKKLTDIPMVVNTSFNIRGEPIVESPKDAIRCFLGNGIDYLVMGDFIVMKET